MKTKKISFFGNFYIIKNFLFFIKYKTYFIKEQFYKLRLNNFIHTLYLLNNR